MLGTQHCLPWLDKVQDRGQSSGLSSSSRTVLLRSSGCPNPQYRLVWGLSWVLTVCPNPYSQTCSLETAGLLKVIKARW